MPFEIKKSNRIFGRLDQSIATVSKLMGGIRGSWQHWKVTCLPTNANAPLTPSTCPLYACPLLRNQTTSRDQYSSRVTLISWIPSKSSFITEIRILHGSSANRFFYVFLSSSPKTSASISHHERFCILMHVVVTVKTINLENFRLPLHFKLKKNVRRFCWIFFLHNVKIPRFEWFGFI